METNFLFIFIALFLHFIAFVWLVITAFKRSVVWGLAVFFLSLLIAPIPAIVFAVTNWFDAKKPFLAYLLTMILVFVPLVMMSNSVDQEFMLRLQEKVESGEIKESEMMEYINNPELLDELDQQAEGLADDGVVLNEQGEPIPNTPDGKSGEEWEDIKPVVEDPDKPGADKPADAKATAEKSGKEEPEVIVEEEEYSDYPKRGQVKPDPLVTKRKPAPKDSVKVSVSKIGNYKGRYFIITTKSGSQHRGILKKITKSRIVLERKIYGGTFTYKILKSKIKRVDMLKKEYIDDGT